MDGRGQWGGCGMFVGGACEWAWPGWVESEKTSLVGGVCLSGAVTWRGCSPYWAWPEGGGVSSLTPPPDHTQPGAAPCFTTPLAGAAWCPPSAPPTSASVPKVGPRPPNPTHPAQHPSPGVGDTHPHPPAPHTPWVETSRCLGPPPPQHPIPWEGGGHPQPPSTPPRWGRGGVTQRCPSPQGGVPGSGGGRGPSR